MKYKFLPLVESEKYPNCGYVGFENNKEQKWDIYKINLIECTIESVEIDFILTYDDWNNSWKHLVGLDPKKEIVKIIEERE